MVWVMARVAVEKLVCVFFLSAGFFLFIVLICVSILYFLLHFILYTHDKLYKAKGALRDLSVVTIVGLRKS